MDIKPVHRSRWDEISRSSSRLNYVYVISEENGPTKIGVARNAFWRLSDLQCGNPRKLSLYALFASSERADCVMLEAAVLGEFADSRLLGEWVNASAEKVASFCQIYADRG